MADIVVEAAACTGWARLELDAGTVMSTALGAARFLSQAALTCGCMQQSLLISTVRETLLSECTAHGHQRAASSCQVHILPATTGTTSQIAWPVQLTRASNRHGARVGRIVDTIEKALRNIYLR